MQKEGLNQDLVSFASRARGLSASCDRKTSRVPFRSIMYGAGEFDNSDGLGLLLGAAQAGTGAVDEAAIPSPPPAFTPGPANGPLGVNRSPEPVTQLEQEDLDPQMRDGVPAWAALDPVKLGDGCPGT